MSLRTLLLLLPLLCGSLLPSPGRADLECSQPMVQAGEVRSGRPLAHRFVFVNRGTEAVEITQVKPSCGCLTPRLDKRHLEPGETGTLLLEINTLTQPEGPHSWSVQLHYKGGGQDRDFSLVLCARLLTEVTVQPASLTLFTDSALSHPLTLIDRRPQPLAITTVQTNHPAVRAVVQPPVRDLAGHFVSTIDLHVSPDCPEGRHERMLSLFTSDPLYPELRVPFTVVKRSRQQVSAAPAEVTLTGRPGQPLPSRIVLLSSPDGQEVRVERVEADDPAIHCQWAKGPGPRTTLKVQIDSTRLGSTGLRSAVHVHLQQPAPQTLTLPVLVVDH
jgi:hypothetical protein